MYDDFGNQLYNFGHYAFSFWLLLIFVPKLIFASASSDRLDRLAANMLRASCLYILLGYALVVTKLFEVLSIVGILAFLILRSYVSDKKGKEGDLATSSIARFYDLLELAFRVKIGWKHLRGRLVLTDKRISLPKWSFSAWLSAALTVAVMSSSAYVRMYDGFKHAAPSMSDGAVILAWVNYINRRDLFHDGVYPQGHMILMAFLQKFAQIETLYVLKYTGGLSTFLIVLGLYFAVSRLAGNRLAALAAAGMYGLGGTALHGADWERQATTIPQEFAYLYLLPTMYFFYRYFESGRRQDLWIGAAGCAVMGLSHTISFAYSGLALGILMFFSVFQGKEGWKKGLAGGIAGIGCVVVAAIPILYGRFIGSELHGSSANFLAAQAEFTPPPLNDWDFVGFGCLAVTALGALFVRGQRLMFGYAFLFGAACFLIYFYGGTLTQNVVMQTRSESAWTIATCLTAGMAWHAAAKLLLPWKNGWRIALETLLCAAAVTAIAYPMRLEPIVPYKMMWNSNAEQYLRIANEHYRRTWVVYSQSEGYSLSLGSGIHDYISTLIQNYDPTKFPLTRRTETRVDVNVSYHIYIIEEKQVYQVDPNLPIHGLLAQEYERREAEYAELRKWLAAYQDFNKDLKVFYEDEYVKVYYIHRATDSEGESDALWAKPVMSDLLIKGEQNE